ncbi:MAG: DegV family protein [Clostridia bacterium]|nr:DegV family protein [Clostridia bacterium]
MINIRFCWRVSFLGNDYILSTCSTCDMTNEFCKKRDINYAKFHYFINGTEYTDDMGKSMSAEEFYSKITPKGVDVKTSQVNVAEFIEYFTPFLESGKDILHISTSTGISGVYNSAKIAATEVSKKFPERKVYVVDSLGGSSGMGLIMDTLADMRDAGKDIEELKSWIENNKLRLHHWFCTCDLSFFIRGGRISKAAGLVGSVLKICPVLNVSAEGKLTPRMKVRTKQKALAELCNKMIENAKDGLNYASKCFISQSNCFKDARYLADMIEGKFKQLKERVHIYNIGTTVGSHTGPGTIALFFWGESART